MANGLFAQKDSRDSLRQKQSQLTERINVLKATLSSAETDLKAINDRLAPPAPRWTHKGIAGFSLTQTSFSNWSAGGENSVVGNVYLNADLNYNYNKWLWNNSLNTIYGKMYSPVYRWYKADDNLSITSKLGYAILNDKSLYGTFLVNFQSQYAQGRKSPLDANYISTWMAPGYLNLAAGIDYKPWKWFSLFFSPVNGRITFVNDSYLAGIDAFGIGKDRKSDCKLGTFVNQTMNVNVAKNISFISKLDMFTSYDKNFGNIVVNWDGFLAMKVTKYLTSTVNLGLKYDDKVKTTDKDGVQHGAKLQMKEMIGVGLSYTF
jgi:hypothetical protein